MGNYSAKETVAVEKLEQVIALFNKGEVSLVELESTTTISHNDGDSYGLDEDNETFQTTTVSITFKS